ncbi:hypothetical protein L3X38_013494 [Prunus dulcis]|uniref:Uncharacterized protein n=1 Tax=Prunus dulcis TaxID=3755 RepID=A0AAD4WP23_PRUDU|nr:hypothetical protein L3X38_013494 [Prunus dulcis]
MNAPSFFISDATQSSPSQSPSADDTLTVSSPASSNLSDVNHNNLNAYGVETFVQINSSKNADMPNWKSFDVGRRVMGSGCLMIYLKGNFSEIMQKP